MWLRHPLLFSALRPVLLQSSPKTKFTFYLSPRQHGHLHSLCPTCSAVSTAVGGTPASPCTRAIFLLGSQEGACPGTSRTPGTPGNPEAPGDLPGQPCDVQMSQLNICMNATFLFPMHHFKDTVTFKAFYRTINHSSSSLSRACHVLGFSHTTHMTTYSSKSMAPGPGPGWLERSTPTSPVRGHSRKASHREASVPKHPASETC